jgi:hypothetical protein
MKRKGLLSTILFLALCLTLVCPALAAGEDLDPPLWEQWGYESLEDFLYWYDLETEDEYYAYIADYVAEEQAWIAWRDAYLVEHPGCLDELLAQDPPIWADWGYDSQEALMEGEGLETQSDYEEWLLNWYLRDEFYLYWSEKQYLEERVAMGGPAEGVGVMWMGDYVQFPDAQPELTDGRTMLPVRALMELIGAQVEYLDQTVVLTLADGESISFRPGEQLATVKQENKVSSFEMDVAPYISDGRTYVPVRFFSQALGYDVLWDSDYKTAVILDPQAVIQELDAQFSVVNRVLALALRDEAETYQTAGQLRADVTLFDSLDGDRVAAVTGSFTALSQGDSLDLAGSWDFSSVIPLLTEELGELEPEELAALNTVAKTGFQVIANAEEEMLYLQSPALNTLSELLLGTVDMEIPKNTWIGGSYDPAYFALPAGNLTVGSLIYDSNLSDWYGVKALGWMRSDAAGAAEIVGDGCFESSGSGWVMTLDATDLEALYAELYGADSYYAPDYAAFDLDIRVQKSGACTGSITVREDDFFATTQIVLDFALTSTSATVDLSCHVKNQAAFSANWTSTVTETGMALRTAPPSSANVIQMDAVGELVPLRRAMDLTAQLLPALN